MIDCSVVTSLSPTDNIRKNIKGVVVRRDEENNLIPYKAIVRIYDSKTGCIIQQQITTEDGKFSFIVLNSYVEYTILAKDINKIYEVAVLSDVTT